MKEPKKIKATSLDDLSAVNVTVTIKRPDGKKVDVELRSLSEDEMWTIRRSIKYPKPPVGDFKKVGNDVVPQYNYTDQGYQDAIREADRDLAHRTLIAALTLEIAGETLEEKIVTLKSKLGEYAFVSLIEAVKKINIVSNEEIAAVAASFRPDDDADAQGDDTARDSAE